MPRLGSRDDGPVWETRSDNGQLSHEEIAAAPLAPEQALGAVAVQEEAQPEPESLKTKLRSIIDNGKVYWEDRASLREPRRGAEPSASAPGHKDQLQQILSATNLPEGPSYLGRDAQEKVALRPADGELEEASDAAPSGNEIIRALQADFDGQAHERRSARMEVNTKTEDNRRIGTFEIAEQQIYGAFDIAADATTKQLDVQTELLEASREFSQTTIDLDPFDKVEQQLRAIIDRSRERAERSQAVLHGAVTRRWRSDDGEQLSVATVGNARVDIRNGEQVEVVASGSEFAKQGLAAQPEYQSKLDEIRSPEDVYRVTAALIAEKAGAERVAEAGMKEFIHDRASAAAERFSDDAARIQTREKTVTYSANTEVLVHVNSEQPSIEMRGDHVQRHRPETAEAPVVDILPVAPREVSKEARVAVEPAAKAAHPKASKLHSKLQEARAAVRHGIASLKPKHEFWQRSGVQSVATLMAGIVLVTGAMFVNEKMASKSVRKAPVAARAVPTPTIAPTPTIQMETAPVAAVPVEAAEASVITGAPQAVAGAESQPRLRSQPRSVQVAPRLAVPVVANRPAADTNAKIEQIKAQVRAKQAEIRADIAAKIAKNKASRLRSTAAHIRRSR